MKTAIKWHGGKAYLARRIADLMPDHTRYLEAFAGGLSVLFAKPSEGVAEWANDLNGELTNFWRVLRDREAFAELVRYLEATPLSEVEFSEVAGNGYRGIQTLEMTPIGVKLPATERAAAFFIRNRQSRQGLGRDYCTPTGRTRRGMNENVAAWLSAVDGLPEFHARLRRVEIWSRPAVDAIRKLDAPGLLVYADPPYLHETRSSTGEYGAQEMAPDDHAELLDCLAGMQGRFILSGYPSGLYKSYANRHGWQRVDFDLPNHASGSRAKQRKTECVWCNY